VTQQQSYSPAEVFASQQPGQQVAPKVAAANPQQSYSPSEVFNAPQQPAPNALDFLKGIQPTPGGPTPSNIPANPALTEDAINRMPVSQLLQQARQERGQINQNDAQAQALAANQQRAQAARSQYVQAHPVVGPVVNAANALTRGVQSGMAATHSLVNPTAGHAEQQGLQTVNPVSPSPLATGAELLGGLEIPVAASVVNPIVGAGMLAAQAGGQARSDIAGLRQQGQQISGGQEARQVAGQAAVNAGAGLLFGRVGKFVGDTISGLAPEAAQAVASGDATAIQRLTAGTLSAAGKSGSGAAINLAANTASNAIKKGVDPNTAISQGWQQAGLVGLILPHVMGAGESGETVNAANHGEPEAQTARGTSAAPPVNPGANGEGYFEPKPAQQPPSPAVAEPQAAQPIQPTPAAQPVVKAPQPAAEPNKLAAMLSQPEVKGEGQTAAPSAQEIEPTRPGEQMTFGSAIEQARAAKSQEPQAAGEVGTSRHKGIIALPDQPQLRNDLQAAVRGVGAAKGTVKTTVRNVANVLTKAFPVEANALTKTFRGQEAVPENFDQAKAILRGASNEATNEHAGVMKLLDSTKEAFESMQRDEQLEFQRSMYEGQPVRNPELKPIADQLFRISNERRQQLADLGVEAAKGWEDEHWNMLWRKSPGTESRPARIGGAGALGGRTGANLLQGRSLESFDQGVGAGLEPKNLNPIQQFAETDAAQRRWISMGRAIRSLSDLDNLYRADPEAEENGETRRPGEDDIDVTHLIPQSLRSLVGDPESGDRIYAAPELARLIDNMVTPSWFEGGAIRRGFREAIRRTNNALTQIALGVSGFHLKKTFGLEQPAMTLAEGRPISLIPGEGLPGRAARSEGIQNSMLGLSDMLDPGARRVVDALRTQMTAEHSGWYDNSITTNWKESLKQLDAWGVMKNLIKTPFAASQAVTQDLIFKSVQRAKIAFAFDSLHQYIQAHPDANDSQLATEAGRISDHTDNILGLLNRDNLLWSRTARDIAGMSMLSVGWNYGSSRSLASAGGEVLGALRGEPTGSRNARYWIASAIATAMYGALGTYVATGHGPKSTTDLLFPPSGRKKPDGTPERSNPGFYATDIYEMLTSPLRTIGAKASPVMHILSDLATNRDYKGNMVVNPHDNVAQQAEQLGRYLLDQHLTPISVHNIVSNWSTAETPEEKAVAIVRGLFSRVASTAATSSSAENLAHELMQQHRESMTPEASATFDQRESWIRSLEQSPNDPATLADMRSAIKAGTISMDQGQEILRDAKMAKQFPGASGIPLRHSLTADDLLKVWNAAHSDERQQMLKPFEARFKQIDPDKAQDMKDWVTLAHTVRAFAK
jgi:hypothetical protein